ncbi:MAG: hypothetical protein MJ123_11855 [Lachnospiraceae bacterium]|nr:hypothetical protein [Lachnospiraceae bacterium]
MKDKILEMINLSFLVSEKMKELKKPYQVINHINHNISLYEVTIIKNDDVWRMASLYSNSGYYQANDNTFRTDIPTAIEKIIKNLKKIAETGDESYFDDENVWHRCGRGED